MTYDQAPAISSPEGATLDRPAACQGGRAGSQAPGIEGGGYQVADRPGTPTQARDRLLSTPAIDCAVAMVLGLYALAILAPHL